MTWRHSLRTFLTSPTQPIAYTGPHLARLEAMYLEEISAPIEFVLARIMVVGALVRMIADTARYISDAITNSLQHRKLTPIGMQSLGKAGRYLSLACFTCVLGLLSPTLIVRLARRVSIVPHQCWITSLESTIVSIAYTGLALIACYCIAYISLLTDRTLRTLPTETMQQWLKGFGRTNVRAATIAATVIASAGVSYQIAVKAYEWGSTNGWWVCYRLVAYICLPRNFSP